MCGICGFTGKKDEHVVKEMARTIKHRGPDDKGFYFDGLVNLGVSRLSIVDIEGGRQPISNEDGSVWVVFNGEIYNHVELRQQISEKGHTFMTNHSDTEVIVHLYEEYGTDFVHKMNGMFAIALWDKKNESLFLIRDRMGVKPLFYAYINGTLIFGSEIKAILAHPAYSRMISYEAVYHYFSLKNIPSPMTAFKDIYSLLPGEIIVCSKNKLSKHRWWRIKFSENNSLDEEYIKGNILYLLNDATAFRMRSDVPVGAYLSGGVDSSSVVALMARHTDKTIKTFSLGYEDELKNKEADLYYARKVSEAYKTEHHEYIMSYKELIDDIGNVIAAFDQPFSGTISTYFLTKLISKHVKVALSGDGADELFGSYFSHRVAQPIFHFKRFYDKAVAGVLTEDEKRLFAPCDISFLKSIYDKSEGDEVLWRYSLYLFSDIDKENLLSGHFKSHLNGTSSLSVVKKYFDGLTAKNPLNRILEMEWNTQLPDQCLAFVDFLSMAHSVEIRSPFLDYRLVIFVATIPGNMKIKDGNIKDILKKTVEPLLPEGITKRPKEGFVLPVFDWMEEKIRDYSMDMLSEGRLKKHGLLNVDTVKGILQGYHAGNRSYAGKVWNLIMFQLWWEKYFG